MTRNTDTKMSIATMIRGQDEDHLRLCLRLSKTKYSGLVVSSKSSEEEKTKVHLIQHRKRGD